MTAQMLDRLCSTIERCTWWRVGFIEFSQSWYLAGSVSHETIGKIQPKTIIKTGGLRMIRTAPLVTLSSHKCLQIDAKDIESRPSIELGEFDSIPDLNEIW
jgi:hypothetical protein